MRTPATVVDRFPQSGRTGAKRASVLLGAGLTCLCFAAVAAEPIRAVDRPLTKAEARFRALDANNDRKLSPEEFQADATSHTEFAKLDTDSDGFLSMAEFTSRPIPPATTPPKSQE